MTNKKLCKNLIFYWIMYRGVPSRVRVGRTHPPSILSKYFCCFVERESDMTPHISQCCLYKELSPFFSCDTVKKYIAITNVCGCLCMRGVIAFDPSQQLKLFRFSDQLFAANKKQELSINRSIPFRAFGYFNQQTFCNQVTDLLATAYWLLLERKDVAAVIVASSKQLQQ